MRKILSLLAVSVLILLLICPSALAAGNYKVYYELFPASQITLNSASITGTIQIGEMIDDKETIPGYVYELRYWEENNPSDIKRLSIGAAGIPYDIKHISLSITGLKPNTKYVYTFFSGISFEPLPGTPSTLSFKTLPEVGDLNADGYIDSTDCTLMNRYLLHIINDFPSESDIWVSDVNGDWSIDSTDYVLLKRFVLNIISEFPKK